MTYQQLSSQLLEWDAATENHGVTGETSSVSVSERIWDGESMMERECEMESHNLKWGVQRKY
jgi:hypothetical protein